MCEFSWQVIDSRFFVLKNSMLFDFALMANLKLNRGSLEGVPLCGDVRLRKHNGISYSFNFPFSVPLILNPEVTFRFFHLFSLTF